MNADALPLLALLALAGCGGSTSFQYTNASTDAQLNAIAANTSDTAGASDAGGARQMGERIRAQAASPPPPRS